jgi:putative ABC transport system substrate-binding protein
VQPPTIALVVTAGSDASREIAAAVRQQLESRRIRVGIDVAVEAGREGAAVAALGSARADVTVAIGPRALDAATRVGGTSIVVSAYATNAFDAASRTTGVFLDFPLDQQVQSLRRVLPATIRRVGVIYSAQSNERAIARLRESLPAAGFVLVARAVTTPAEIPAALASMADAADILWGLPDDVVMTPETARSILLFSMRNRLPLIGVSDAWVRAGALIALDRHHADLGAQVVDLALRVGGGDAARTLAPERPRKMIYALNLRTAEQMGIRFSPEAVRGAEVVQR